MPSFESSYSRSVSAPCSMIQVSNPQMVERYDRIHCRSARAVVGVPLLPCYALKIPAGPNYLSFVSHRSIIDHVPRYYTTICRCLRLHHRELSNLACQPYIKQNALFVLISMRQLHFISHSTSSEADECACSQPPQPSSSFLHTAPQQI